MISALPTCIFGFLFSALLLGFRPPPTALPGLALAVIVTCASCTGFGMALGSVGLRVRDVFLISNIAYFLMLLLCGVEVPLRQLPAPLRDLAQIVPLTHGIAAGRMLAQGASFTAAAPDILWELLVGASWASAAYLLFAYFERAGRRSGAFDRL